MSDSEPLPPVSADTNASSDPNPGANTDSTAVTPAPEEPVPPASDSVNTEPPALAPLPEEAAPPPPLPPSTPTAATPPPPRVPRWLITALLVLAAALITFAMTSQPDRPVASVAGYRVGAMLGLLVIFPAMIMALFAIARPFRSWRRQLYVLLGVWGLFTLSQLGQRSLPGPSTPQQNAARALARWRATLSNGEPLLAPQPFTSTLSQDVFALPPPPHPLASKLPAAALRFDFSPGSDERLIKLIDRSQETTYHEVTSAYAAACAAWPDNALLAVERVRFIARYAQAEDVTIDSAADDYAEARKDLLARFPRAPEAVLYLLETSWGDAFEREAARGEPLVEDWPRADRARFHLLRAQRENLRNPAGAVGDARTAFDLQPSAEAGLLLARAAHTAGRDAEAATLLRHAVFGEASPWIKRQRMDLLFDVHENAAASAAYDELAAKAPEHVRNHATALHLAQIGRLADARAVLALIPTAEWNRRQTDRERFDFELRYGQSADAVAAYRQLRADGFTADPFARARVALWSKAPRAGWTWADGLGILALAGLLTGAAALPLLLLVPVHYWSFWRQRAARASAWVLTPWGLRSAWRVGALIAVGQTLAIWIFRPETLAGMFAAKTAFPATAQGPAADLGAPLALWTIEAVVLAGLFWKARAWSLFGQGRWGTGATIGAAVGAAVGVRLLLGLYLIWVPSAREAISPVASYTFDVLHTLQQRTGSLGLIAIVAIAVPVIEEMLFRGVILGALARHIPFWAANTLQAAVFASLHENVLLLPFLFALALIAGLFVRQSGSLRPAILLHVTNNLLACAGFILLSHRPAL